MSFEPGTENLDRCRQAGSAHRRLAHLGARAARFAVCVGLAAALPVASFSAASAASLNNHGHHGTPPSPPSPKPVLHVNGSVGTISTTSFTLTATSGTITVNVATNTVFRQPTVKHPGLASLMTGDKVRVTGTSGGTGIINATSVFIPMVVKVGKVATLISGGTSSGFTMTTAKGVTVTVNVSTSTKYREAGKKSASLADVLVGRKVTVAGANGGTNIINATSVMINPFAGHGKK